VRLSTFITSAFTGTRRLPDIRKRRISVASATTPTTRGSRSSTASLLSTNRALEPVTPNGNGVSRPRMRCTSVAPRGEKGSTSGTTESQVPRPPSSGRKRAVRFSPTNVAGTMKRPSSRRSTPGSPVSTCASSESAITP
jgi:hypothetical protein